MPMSRSERSAASRVFLVLLAVIVVFATTVAGLLVLESRRSAQFEAERVTRAAAASLATDPDIVHGLGAPDAAAALQPFADRALSAASLDFITIMRPDGTRLTHPDPAQIGKVYVGTIPSDGLPATEQYTGTLGASIRSIHPVQVDDRVLGWVAAGVTLEHVTQSFVDRIPLIAVTTVVLVVLGVLAALVARRALRRVTGELSAESLRAAVSSYESVRTLGEALRAQTHEHGNRTHTVVALLELGRTDEAIEILTDSAAQSQRLVDLVSEGRGGDPTVGALLLGKAAQAQERGIEWKVEIAADTPRSVLSATDAVSVVGNLVDNALDAAASGDETRWCSVSLTRDDDQVRIVVSDSGPGVPAALRERVFEHGFSTKPAGAQGRGVGLALVCSLVDAHGGTLSLTDDPTTFTLRIPGRRS